MRPRNLLPLFLLVVLITGRQTIVRAQQPASSPCSVPVFNTVVNEPNLFSEQQEEWLGDTVARRISRDFNFIADPDGDYLQKLGEKLLAQLPPSAIHYRFSIIDLPENNSFGIFGGNIYISRKIIALAQNEDELAGLLGHEIGHIFTRQPAIDITREFQSVLGASKLGDQNDVLEKWNRLLDTIATGHSTYSQKRSDQEQLIADRIALYAMTRAGYQPSRYVDFFDRLAETKGNKGSFWTDLFGRTSRDSKRLRELLRTSSPLAQNCVTTGAPASSDHFSKWQQAVIAAKFAEVREDLPGLLAKKTLKPPLRSDLEVVRFSPDGNYVLAQDETSIFVLTSPMVTLVLTIDAPDSSAAQFTPDSHSVVFYDKEFRVEKWDIATRTRVSVHELALATHCLQTRLSHSGDVMACLTTDYELQLIDVSTGTPVFKGQKLRTPSKEEMAINEMFSLFEGTSYELFTMHFSPGDRYFLTAHQNSALAYDLQAHAEIKLPRNVKDVVGDSFVFLSDDEIAGFKYGRQKLVGRVKFPSGEIVEAFFTGLQGYLSAPAKGNYLLFRNSDDRAVTALDLQTKRATVVYKKPGFDLFDKVFAGETSSGELGIFNVADRKYLGGIDMPDGPLDTARAVAFSADGKWLAISGRSRGGIWKLDSGERALLTWGFDGAFFDQDELLAKCSKPTNQTPGVYKFDTSTLHPESLYSLPSTPEHASGIWELLTVPRIWQRDDLLIKITFDQSNLKSPQFLLEVFDVRNNNKLWERRFQKDRPRLFYSRSGKTITVVVGNYNAMKIEAANDPRLGAKLNALVDEQRRKDSYIILSFDAVTGKSLGSVLVDSGNLSFSVSAAYTVGDTVMVNAISRGMAGQDRTLLYSLASGEQRGKVFGTVLAVSKASHAMLVESGKQELMLYDMAGSTPLVRFTFPQRLGYIEFSADGTNIMVITVDQTVYFLKAQAQPQTASAGMK